jgi:copper(I)-binding protein
MPTQHVPARRTFAFEVRANPAVLITFVRWLPLAAALFAMDAGATLTVNLPWIKTVAGGAEVYLQITSTDAGEIVEARSFAARTTSLLAAGKTHQVLKAIPLDAGIARELAPGQYRIGLSGLVRPLKPRELVPLTLVVKSAAGLRQEVLITAEVRSRSAHEDEGKPHHTH